MLECLSVSNETLRTTEPAAEPKAELVVDPATWRQISLTAAMVGGDFGMQVRLGKPGEGNFFDPERVAITLDSELVATEPITAEFVAAHEGAHRAITGHPKEVGLSKKAVEERYRQIGYASVHNYIEDPAVNDWLKQEYPGLRILIADIYDKMFADASRPVVTPEATELIQKLGRVPYFVQYGTELMRRWHSGSYQEQLAEPVALALSQTESDVDETVATIPVKGVRRQTKVRQAFSDRFSIVDQRVWPVVQELVKLDVELGQLQEAQRQIENYEQIVGPVSDGLKQTIEDLIKQRNEPEQGGDAGQSGEDGESESGQGGEAGEGGQPGEGRKSGKGGESGESGVGRSTGKKPGQKPGQSAGQSAGQPGSETADNDTETKAGSGSVWDELTDAERAELGEIVKTNTGDAEKAWREQLREIVEQLLKEIEAAIAAEMEGQLLTENQGNSGKVNGQGGGVGPVGQQQANAEAQKNFVANLTHHEQVRQQVRPEIETMYRSLLRVMRPDQFSDTQSGYSSGSIPDLARLMQAEVDPEQLNRIWEREVDPQLRDYRFFHLVDTSGSMGSFLPAVHAGLVVTTEALGRLEMLNTSESKVRQAVAAFDDTVHPVKCFNERQQFEVEQKLSALASYSGGSTQTATGTKYALEQINADLGRSGNFILTYTDGDTGQARELVSMLEGSQAERRRDKLALGLVWVRPGITPEQLRSHCRTYGYDFGVALPITGQDPKELAAFSQNLADELERMIRSNN